MADFQPRFVDLVRNYTTTVGTGDFVLGAAVNGYSSFASALQPGDGFYYSAIGVDKPIEREVGRGTLQANGTVSRDPVSGIKTNFSSGIKSVSLIAAAEWFNTIQAGAGGGANSGTGTASSRTSLAAIAQRQLPVVLAEAGREGLFVFDGSNLSAKVAGDPNQGIYVPPSSDPTGASGAWVRKYDGAVHLKWFGVAAGAPNNAARVESAIDLVGAGTYQLPKGDIAFDRDVYIRKEIVLRGHGSSSRQVGTRCQFPPGCSGFRTSWDHVDASGQDPYDAKFVDFAVYQPSRNTNAVIVNYSAATRTVTLPSPGDWQNGQVVWIEGAGYPHTLIGKTAAISSGSNVATISSAGGNPGVHVGQLIDIAGAGLPPGTAVTAWASNTITLSNSATATVSAALYTVTYPLVARIVSGAGTTTLVLDTVFQHYSASNVLMRHADSGILADRPIQIENVSATGFPIGVNLAGDLANVPANGTNTSAVRYCRLSSDLASLYMGGEDGNASSVWGCDFSFSTRYGVLDLSLIGNYYFGCHFAFNVGIANPLPSTFSTLVACYFESGTSFVGNGQSYAFGCTGFRNGSGWNYWGATDDFSNTGNAPSISIGGTRGAITAPEAYLGGRSIIKRTGRYRIQTDINGPMADGADGIGLELGADGSAFYQLAYNRTSGSYALQRLAGSAIEIQPGGTTTATFDTNGIDLASGKALSVGGQQVVGTRGASLPSDANDLTTAIALVNAIKARLKTTGGHGLVAD